MSKRRAYHQGLGHDTDRCYNLCHAIQDLIDTKVIALPTRPNITKNPLPIHNVGSGPRINCLISKEEGEEDPFESIYDLPECFMMTWEELLGMTSTTGYDICSGDTAEIPNYLTSTYGGRYFKPHSNNPTSTYGERHFKPHSGDPTPTYGGRHFKPHLDYPTPTYGGKTLQTPRH